MSFEQLERRVRNRARAAGNAIAIAAPAEAEKEFRKHHKSQTGQLVNSIKARVQVERNVVRVTVQTGDLIQAKTTNRGARPHVIRPRKGQFLAFHWDKADPDRHRMLPDGRVLFRSVNHPGNRGSGWWDTAMETVRKKVVPRAWRLTRGM